MGRRKLSILLTGGNGFIAKNLKRSLAGSYDITSVTRSDFNLLDREAVSKYFADKYFDVVIHTAIVGGSRLKLDQSDVLLHNLVMHYNLVANSDKFDRFISFGSGAELNLPLDPYGLSKHVIAESVKLLGKKAINIRIFAMFGEDEPETRFIKSNIKRYIERKALVIHQDKYMDFYYVEDLITLVDWLISNSEKNNREFTLSTVDCKYSTNYKLSDIAGIINELDDYRVKVEVNELNLGKPYIGAYTELPFSVAGLEKGIKSVYNKLK